MDFVISEPSRCETPWFYFSERITLLYKIKMETEVNKLFICACNSVEHQMIVSYIEEDECKEVFCSVHLSPEPNILKRIWKALKYVFGHRSKYGDFDEFIFKSSDSGKLQEVVDYLKRGEK